jgi:dihydroorotase
MKLLIKNGHLIDAKTGLDGIYDLLAEDGRIIEISRQIDTDCGEIIDAAGKHVLPGLVDAHCHLRDPGFEYKEDIESGTKSAAKGGFTSIACMPNTNPVIDNVSVVQFIKSKSESVGSVNVFPIGAITKGLKGEELAEIGELKFAGVVAISDDGQPVSNPALMRHALEYAQTFDTPIISHCEVKALSDGAMNEGYVSTMLGLRGINRSAEEIMIARDIILAKNTDDITPVVDSVTVNNVPEEFAKVTTNGIPDNTDNILPEANAHARGKKTRENSFYRHYKP